MRKWTSHLTLCIGHTTYWIEPLLRVMVLIGHLDSLLNPIHKIQAKLKKGYLAWSSCQQEKDSLPVNYSGTRRLLHETNPKGIKPPSDSLFLDIRFHSSRNALTLSHITSSTKVVLHSFSPFAL